MSKEVLNGIKAIWLIFYITIHNGELNTVVMVTETTTPKRKWRSPYKNKYINDQRDELYIRELVPQILEISI